jgi:cytochrome b subunit of formate dehydrogenase
LAGQPKSAPELVAELRTLVVDYAKQETIDPLRNLGRYLAFGVMGSVLLAIGGIFLTVGLLRLLQDQTGSAFDGNWSFVPYLLVLVFAAIVLGVLVSKILRTKKANMGSAA